VGARVLLWGSAKGGVRLCSSVGAGGFANLLSGGEG